MKADVLLGLQWGDEGKGKIVDFIAPNYNVVARFQGGPNAGHTLEFDGIKHVLHQIPSGIFRSDIKNVIGNGVVLDPIVFKKEIDALAKYNLNIYENLFISKKAQLIIPTHRLLDQAYEKDKGDNKIGSTLKGIGPCYQDKVARQGLRVGDILSDNFHVKYNELLEKHKTILNFYNSPIDIGQLEKEFFDAVEFIKQFKIIDTEQFLNDCLKSNQKILAEGAQGSLLDIDFGSYPFVTSSNTMVAGACTGLGLAPRNIGEVFGIFKAYSTRVGGGPFPTELFNEEGDFLRKIGNEFGSTTGRPRRCGWIDIPALKYAIMINGVSHLIMMKADVLNEFDLIKVCTHYKLTSGEIVDIMPFETIEDKVEPIYKELPGWNTELNAVTSFEQLPQNLLNYIQYLEDELQVPITMLSYGPDRLKTLSRSGTLQIVF